MDSADAKAKKDFFISYTGADEEVASWIAWILEEAGYDVVLQAWDFHAGGNFVLEMHRAARETTRTIAVVSPKYLDALFTHPEWAAAFALDPTGTERLLIPIRVVDFKPDGMFTGKIYIDLVGLKEDEAKAKLLDEIAKSIQGGSIPPSTPPAFPQSAKRPAQSAATAPRFPGTLPDHHNLPHRNPNFSGREKVLSTLRESMLKERNTALTQQALHGLGGIGKTQLAVEYAYRHSASYEVIWWIRSEEPSTLASDFSALALELNLPEKEQANQAVVVQAVTRWLERNNNWLLIFDNARDADSIKPYLPRSASGHVLITSRNPDWRSVVNPLPVEVWERNESVAFLLKRTERTDEAGANALAEALGDLPLALEQAAAYCDNKKKSFADYLTLFNTRRKELWNREKAPDGYKETVATTWSLAFEEIRKVPMAEELLSLCSIVAPDAIPRTLLDRALEIWVGGVNKEEKLDEFVIDDAYEALRSYSLIMLDEKLVTVHRLVQSVVCDQMNEDDLAVCRMLMVMALSEQFPQGAFSNPSCWPECETLFPHVQILLKDNFHDHDLAWSVMADLLNIIGSYCHRRAAYADSELLFRRALEIKEKHLGPDHPFVATSLNNLGLLLKEQGKFGEVEVLYRRAFEIYKKHLGSNHPYVASSLGNIASLLQIQGKYDEAELLHRRALEIDESVYGTAHPDVAIDFNSLGMLLYNQEKYEEAELMYRRAQEINEKHFGPDHPYVAVNLNNLGLLRQAQGKNEEAERLYRGSLEIDEKVYGTKHPEVATDLNNLGVLLQAQGKYLEAEPMFRRALEIREMKLGSEHPHTKISRKNLDDLLQKMQGEQ
ncbi:toll/interleukin-1 receptor domain-containing protein [Chlorobaculum sp. 24CR]|uniref:FxSxx-COOH system tetratricopeptide repeat protein n=1 Tax=Chlorobaculum sp. 24CR TaxID=2508878 RepID=UPI00100A6187|nr:FxSxx-COOH system tetratricopeptide repeat protein [Chlorobaculum sp. 24CR]RXK87889.1 toll/interleukin-1 receptor domain-containing protein [Chlorobaculum sp. 24CR]